MYEGEAKKQMQSNLAPGVLGGDISRGHRNTTVGQNIDNRIQQLREEIARLEVVKAKLAQPTGLLDVPLNDLAMAMRSY